MVATGFLTLALVSHWFALFQEEFNKTYSFSEIENRYAVFKDNYYNIHSHNYGKKQNYTLKMNEFMDLTQEEFKQKYIGSGIDLRNSQVKCGLYNYSRDINDLPESVDWVKDGCVTPVKNQGSCGSCWAFSSTGALEGAWAKKTGKLISLSEQQLVDCAGGRYGNHGCNGGLMDNAFKYVFDNGLCSEEAYPYTSGYASGNTFGHTFGHSFGHALNKDPTVKNVCNAAICHSSISVVGCSDVEKNNQLALKVAVAHGPVSIAVEADTKIFQFYSGGVVTDIALCGQNLDHGVLIVGYGVENGLKYWLVKNSWGEDWGQDGYIKLGRSDSADDAGVCGVAKQASLPLV